MEKAPHERKRQKQPSLDEFERVVVEKLEEFFRTTFGGVREALVFRRQHLLQNATKLKINWAEIGARFQINQRQAHIRFECLEQKYLDKWTAEELRRMREAMTELYPVAHDKQTLRRRVDERLNISAQVTKCSKQLENVFSFHYEKLSNEK